MRHVGKQKRRLLLCSTAMVVGLYIFWATSLPAQEHFDVDSPIKSTCKFYDVSVVGEKHVWVVGYFGAIFYSEDGGKSWIEKSAGTNNALLGVCFASENEGWVVGEYGTILHTEDRGKTWEAQAYTLRLLA